MAHLRDRRPHAYTPVGASPARSETVADGAPVAAA
jgi:hypothetical protein